MSIALANSPLPSARNSILPSALLAFFHASITKPSLTAVTAMESMPLALMAAAFCTKPGRWFLWQGGGEGPGAGENTALFSLNNPSVGFHARTFAGVHLYLRSVYGAPS